MGYWNAPRKTSQANPEAGDTGPQPDRATLAAAAADSFSATIGMAVFYGREQRADISSNGIGPAAQQQGDWAYQGGAQNGISIVRDRDEVYLRIRYTF